MLAYCGSLPSTTGTTTVTSPALSKVSVMLAVPPGARSALVTAIGAWSVSTICAPLAMLTVLLKVTVSGAPSLPSNLMA